MRRILLTAAAVMAIALPTLRAQSDFNLCLQSSGNDGYVLFSDVTGQYDFFCNGSEQASGTGELSAKGTSGMIVHHKGARTVTIQWDTSANGGVGSGSASIQSSGVTKCSVTDSDMSNNSCD